MRKRSSIVDFLVYLAVRVVVCAIAALSWHRARGFADALAWLMHRVDKRHRQVAIENSKLAFPTWTDAEIDVHVRKTYEHFSLMLVEMIKAPRTMRKRNLETYFQYGDPADFDRVMKLLHSKRPLLFLGGHFGNWELFGFATGLFGTSISAIARPLDNPHLDRMLNQFRGNNGHRVVAKKGEYDQIHAVLEGGGNLGLLFDQDAGEKGLFVDFFGRPASTFKSIALLSLEYKAPLIVGGAVRVGEPMRYRVVVGDIIDPLEYEQNPNAVREITQRFTAALEKLIRENPEQYFWLHRRWKHSPPARKAKSKAA